MSAKLAHDLKGPLNTLSMYLELASAEAQDHGVSGVALHLDGARANISQMARFIDDLIGFYRVAKPRELSRVDMRALVSDIVQKNRALVLSAHAKVVFEGRALIRAFRTPVELILQNLIVNAIRYRRPSVEPSVKVSVKLEDHAYTVTVEDNGQGIDPRDSKNLFEVFRRGRNAGDVAGSGIGLATCKRMIEDLGGRIWFQSALGQGTTFHFTIPRAIT
jgi:signal transduction histidine kinase